MSSRMHCCIGAYSSGVPVFTLGYSRKFNGIFIDTLKYPYGSDLRGDELKTVIQKLYDFLSNLSEIIKDERERFVQSLTQTFSRCIIK